MKEEIFREKSLEKVKSPDNLDDYIHVSSPGVWLLLVSVLVLLAGAFVWGIYGHVDSTVSCGVFVDDGAAVCYIAEEDISLVEVGMAVKFAETEAEIVSIGEAGENGVECTLSAVPAIADGFYEGRAVTRSYRPISFILQ